MAKTLLFKLNNMSKKKLIINFHIVKKIADHITFAKNKLKKNQNLTFVYVFCNLSKKAHNVEKW